MVEERIILAGGCFWGLQHLLRDKNGVLSTRVGYCGGKLKNPTYKDICRGLSGHAEALEVIYNSDVLSTFDLLALFFQIHDPTTLNQQGNDKGHQYRSAIFYTTKEQHEQSLAIISKVNDSGLWPGPVVTEVLLASDFWPAEQEHQDYLVKHPNGYTCHFVRKNWQLSS